MISGSRLIYYKIVEQLIFHTLKLYIRFNRVELDSSWLNFWPCESLSIEVIGTVIYCGNNLHWSLIYSFYFNLQPNFTSLNWSWILKLENILSSLFTQILTIRIFEDVNLISYFMVFEIFSQFRHFELCKVNLKLRFKCSRNLLKMSEINMRKKVLESSNKNIKNKGFGYKTHY